MSLIREDEGAADPVRILTDLFGILLLHTGFFLLGIGTELRDDLIDHVEDLFAHILRHRFIAKRIVERLHFRCEFFVFLTISTHFLSLPSGHIPHKRT